MLQRRRLPLSVVGPVDRHNAQINACEVRRAEWRLRTPRRIVRIRNMERIVAL